MEKRKTKFRTCNAPTEPVSWQEEEEEEEEEVSITDDVFLMGGLGEVLDVFLQVSTGDVHGCRCLGKVIQGCLKQPNARWTGSVNPSVFLCLFT